MATLSAESAAVSSSACAESPRVTVIVPVYNALETLPRALEGLRRQDFPATQWELIFVDNGSTDGSWEWLRQTAASPSDTSVTAGAGGGPGRIRVVREERRGPSAARNRGTREADPASEIFLFMDSDCSPRPDWISSMVAAFDAAGPETWAFGGKLESAPPSSVAEWFTDRQRILDVEDFYRPHPYKPPFVLTANFGVRRRAFEKLVGPFNESLLVGEDADFCWRLQMAGGRLGLAREAVVEHRHRTSVTRFARQMFVYGRGSAHIFSLYRDYIGRRVWFDGYSWYALAKAIAKTILFPILRRNRNAWLEGPLEVVRHSCFLAGRLTGALRYRVPVF